MASGAGRVHGTASAYNNYGCRCEACRAAATAARRAWVESLRDRKFAEVPHGTASKRQHVRRPLVLGATVTDENHRHWSAGMLGRPDDGRHRVIFGLHVETALDDALFHHLADDFHDPTFADRR